MLGAPWINERDLAYAVNDAKPPGVRVLPVRFTPTRVEVQRARMPRTQLHHHRLERVPLVRVRARSSPTRCASCTRQNGNRRRLHEAVGQQEVYQQIVDGEDVATILKSVEKDLDEFRERKKEFEIVSSSALSNTLSVTQRSRSKSGTDCVIRKLDIASSCLCLRIEFRSWSVCRCAHCCACWSCHRYCAHGHGRA